MRIGDFENLDIERNHGVDKQMGKGEGGGNFDILFFRGDVS